jgi:hypothetical protein
MATEKFNQEVVDANFYQIGSAICTHPDRCTKTFNTKKVNECCLNCDGGRPCPFLGNSKVFEGRGQTEVTRPNARTRRKYPGE